MCSLFSIFPRKLSRSSICSEADRLKKKIDWLKAHGTITQIPKTTEDERQTYSFVSSVERECVFFVAGDDFVFIGDNTTYVVRE